MTEEPRAGQGAGCSPVPPEVKRALALFDQGRAFEAHEALEDVWRGMPRGPRRSFYQGLIQAMVARVHWERGRIDSARTLIARARGKLTADAAVRLGLDAAAMLSAIEEWDVHLAARRIPPAGELALSRLAERNGTRERDGGSPNG